MTLVEKVLAYYRNNGYNDSDMIYVGAIPVPFKKHWKKIALDMSGGADSTLLAYVLSNYITENNLDIEIHVISHIRAWEVKTWQKHIRESIYKELQKRFPKINYQLHENYIPPEIEMGTIGPVIPTGDGMRAGCQIEDGSYSRYISFMSGVDAKFGATTRNPDDLEDADGASKFRNLDVSGDISNINIISQRFFDKFSFHDPFRVFTKEHIIKYYFDNNLVDLLRMTRSCEGSNMSLMNIDRTGKRYDYYSMPAVYYKPGDYIPECGKCWWCLERKWAFTKLGVSL